MADSTPDGVHQAVEASLADPEVNLVLAAGPVATAWAERRSSLPKPVIGAFVFDPIFKGCRPQCPPSASVPAAGLDACASRQMPGWMIWRRQ